jgi:hypothetical protein
MLCPALLRWILEAYFIPYDDNVSVYAFTIRNNGKNASVMSNSLFIDVEISAGRGESKNMAGEANDESKKGARNHEGGW